MYGTGIVTNYMEKINQFHYIAVGQLVIYMKISRPISQPHIMGKNKFSWINILNVKSKILLFLEEKNKTMFLWSSGIKNVNKIHRL